MKAKITISDLAARKIGEVLAAAGEKAQGLRVQVIGGGPSGLRTKIALDVERDGDRVLEKKEARVFIDPKSLVYINGVELDYKEGAIESSFILAEAQMRSIRPCDIDFPLYAEVPDVPHIW